MMVSNNRIIAARLERFYFSQELRSRLAQCRIHLLGLMDHYLITVKIVVSQGVRVRSNLCFKNKLLHDRNFCERFKWFWERWRLKNPEFGSLKLWWEVGKAQIWGFYQQCTSSSTAKLKTAMEKLKANIKGIAFGVHMMMMMMMIHMMAWPLPLVIGPRTRWQSWAPSWGRERRETWSDQVSSTGRNGHSKYRWPTFNSQEAE